MAYERQTVPAFAKHRITYLANIAGGTLVAGLGIALICCPLGDGLARLSYDLPFVIHSGGGAEVVMVYLNPKVKQNLREPAGELDRRYHSQMVERLRRDGAKLIFFDFTSFDTPNVNPTVDQQFIRAARAHGRVVLVGELVRSKQMNAALDAVIPPAPELAAGVAAWGLANVEDDKADGAVRRIFPGTLSDPSASWVAAKLLDAPVTRSENNRLRERWLNYYSKPGSLRGVEYDHALQPDGLPGGFFRDKIVVICSGSEAGVAGAAPDEFANPYSRFGARRSFGGEVQALTILNLLNADWLERLGDRCQLALVTLWGLVVGAVLSWQRPWHAVWVAASASVLITGIAAYFQLYGNVWWPWLVPAAVQTPVALIWSVAFQYVLESRRRKMLRQAFAVYLSPHLADRIAQSEFDLSLGGEVVEATIMFSDLEGFTSLSEDLNPQEVSRILTTYFNRTTRAILEQEGTIIKYMGDAVEAVWGAPLPDPKQATRAVRAAWGMIEKGQQEIAGRLLRTRIGINSGQALAGNLGSDFRFDYAVIGDTTNLASRLESLNKNLGTQILISDATRRQLDGHVHTRALGRFLLAGKSKPVAAHEVLGITESATDPSWVLLFNDALALFAERNLEKAVKMFSEAIRARGGHDGPSEFYLRQIAAAQGLQPDKPWDSVVVITSK